MITAVGDGVNAYVAGFPGSRAADRQASKASLVRIICHHRSLHPIRLSRLINCRARVRSLSSIDRSWDSSPRRRNPLIADRIFFVLDSTCGQIVLEPVTEKRS
jgi:hypothetical protein